MHPQNLRKVVFAFSGLIWVIAVGILLFAITSPLQHPAPVWQVKYAALLEKVRQNGTVSIIVGLQVKDTSANQEEIHQTQQQFEAKLSSYNVRITADNLFVPYIVMTVDERALLYLTQLAEVTDVTENQNHAAPKWKPNSW